MTILLDTARASIIVGNYGNDTLALVQWAYEQKMPHLQVVSIDTGWAGTGWLQHVTKAEQWVKQLGFAPVRLVSSPDFTQLMQQRQAFPTPKFQWCANILKGSTLLAWLDKVDPEGQYQILIGHRRVSARSKQNLQAVNPGSDAFDQRTVFYPLVDVSTDERNQLLLRAGFMALAQRSLECDPCVNANLMDLQRLSSTDFSRLTKLENELDRKMFEFPVKNLPKLMANANQPLSDVLENMGCGDFYGCGI